MRVRRIRWKRHVPAWRERWAFAELIAKCARVEIARDGAWVVTW